MHTKRVKRVIQTEPFHPATPEIAQQRREGANDNRRPGRHESRTRRDGHQSRHHAGAEAQDGQFLRPQGVERDPGETAGRRRDTGDGGGQSGARIGRPGGAAVEGQPAEPEDSGAQGHVDEGVGFGVDVASFAEHQAVGESGEPRSDVDWPATSEIVRAVEAGHLNKMNLDQLNLLKFSNSN